MRPSSGNPAWSGVSRLRRVRRKSASSLRLSIAPVCRSRAQRFRSWAALAVPASPKTVRVSAIEPGTVGTELQSHVTGAREWLESSTETMEWRTAKDIAHTVGFLASQPVRVNLQQVTIMPTGQTS
ncbi:SDR family oxidoreductase [Streptomyces sp. NPDC004096]